MRTHQMTDSERHDSLKRELARFKELYAKKEEMMNGDLTIQNVDQFIKDFELVKAQLKDCVEEINHLHRKLYPNFPRKGSCYVCGADMLPVAGSATPMNGCICCGETSLEWRL